MYCPSTAAKYATKIFVETASSNKTNKKAKKSEESEESNRKETKKFQE